MTNSAIHQMNGRLLPVLEGVTGQSYGEDRRPGKRGGRTRRATPSPPKGSTYKPTSIDQIRRRSRFAHHPAHTVPGSRPVVTPASAPGRRSAPAGSVAIEAIKVGDQVLAQDTRTGELSFQPVLAVFHNPPDRDAPRLARRRGDRRHRHPPLLEGRARLGHGPRPQGRRPDPDPRRRGPGDGRRGGRGPSRSSTSRWPRGRLLRGPSRGPWCTTTASCSRPPSRSTPPPTWRPSHRSSALSLSVMRSVRPGVTLDVVRRRPPAR